nr:DNA repair protein RadC [Saprospiraceae bacterium]
MKPTLHTTQNIKSWAAEDRPREKLMYNGVRSLTNAELMAILLGSGSRNQSALDLAKAILSSCNNDLDELGRYTLDDLTQFIGVGPAKAVTISAAVELGRRRKSTKSAEKDKITSSAEAFQLMRPLIADLKVEEFWALYLNRNNRVIKPKLISRGGVSGTVVDPKMVFQPAVQMLCSSIILSHNHPSGNLSPSNEDRLLTEKLARAGKHLDIAILDHLIVSHTGYFSFADEGLI